MSAGNQQLCWHKFQGDGMRTQKPEYIDAASWMKICFWTYVHCCKYRHPIKDFRLKHRYRQAADLACSSLNILPNEPSEETVLALAKHLAYISAYHYDVLVSITALNKLLELCKKFEALIISKKDFITNKERELIGKFIICVRKTGR